MNKQNFLKILVSLVFLLVIFFKIDFVQTFSYLGSTNIFLYVSAALLFIFRFFLASIRWKILLNQQGVHIQMFTLYKTFISGFLVNRIAPSYVGGDVLKVVTLLGEQGGESESSSGLVHATIVDRFIGLYSLIIIIVVSLPFNSLFAETCSIWFIFISLAAVLLIYLLTFRPPAMVASLIQKLLFFQVFKRHYAKLLSSLRVYDRHRMALFASIAISMIFHVLGIIFSFMLFRSTGVEISFILLFFAIPVTKLLTILPISLGGIGLKEITLISILSSKGVSADQIVAYSLLEYSVHIIIALVYLGSSLINRTK